MGGSGEVNEQQVVRRLCAAIERATHLRQWSHGERIARSAVRFIAGHARLAERVARMRLAGGDPDGALVAIDACRRRSASLRLLRAVCLTQLRRRDEAHLDLRRWSGRSTAPLEARLLLAVLDWTGGDVAAATAALRRNLSHLEEPGTLVLLTLLCVSRGREDDARRWATRLRRLTACTGEAAAVDLLLHSLGLHDVVADEEPLPSQVQTLAMELCAGEEIIPALVAAQEREPFPAETRLLSRAIESALPELARPAAACEALAGLWLLQDDPAQAATWARRALELAPMSASAHRLARRCARALELGHPLSIPGLEVGHPRSISGAEAVAEPGHPLSPPGPAEPGHPLSPPGPAERERAA